METAGYTPCDIAYHISCLRHEGRLLADTAAAAGLDAPVPACQGWQVRDLLAHVGYVHRWATSYVAHGLRTRAARASEAELLRAGPGDDALIGWFSDGHGALVEALEKADPGLECWAFLAAPSPLAFWARRQAHETAIHRVDVQQAAAGTGADGVPADGDPFPARLAADGIDELIMGFLARDASRGRWEGLPGTVGIHADDGAAGHADWQVAVAEGKAAVSRGPEQGDCDVAGPAADLYLMLWNRRGTTGLQVRQDSRLLGSLREQLRITWR